METDGHQAYAQIGWWEYAFGQRSVFVQWSVPGAKPFTPIYTPAPPINSVSNYSIHLVNPGGFTYAFNNISLQANGPQYFWPGQAQNFGETLSFASQVPGGFNNAKDFANVSIKFGGSTDWLKGTAFFSGPKYVVDREPGGVLDESCPDQ